MVACRNHGNCSINFIFKLKIAQTNKGDNVGRTPPYLSELMSFGCIHWLLQHGDAKQFLCKCSFLEIYKEQIFDLLEPTSAVLHLRESLKTGVYVAGLSEQVVADASEAYQV